MFAGAHAGRNTSLLAALLDCPDGITCSAAVRDGILALPIVPQEESDELALLLADYIMEGNTDWNSVLTILPRALGFTPVDAFPPWSPRQFHAQAAPVFLYTLLALADVYPGPVDIAFTQLGLLGSRAIIGMRSENCFVVAEYAEPISALRRTLCEVM